MKNYNNIENRVIEVSKYIMASRATIRNTAKVFGTSKSTIHRDMTKILPQLNPQIAEQVKNVLAYNKSIRHIRGGEALRIKKQKERMGITQYTS
ncbi:sporulation transcriptional regulator SpoIIID [Clostridium kluyveri]|uniref:Sporulation transcriptional regulator SpoIIID n=1 Tax=Clostridium kluyveri TaxID=1534 RepID=A0A1L5F895_CLOKL|nr:sporulation transcriptional regulator SpoIIID [Clostridium kluyveri]APM39238.1 sporulation transcriptional regulator SpoIIID [Clostridium kluyveri]UZQ51568.1 sporulation transcriptional regulator SpoIIID [Clostridium kluyveri]